MSLDLANGPSLEGISILNIPSIYGGSNLWGDTPGSKKRRALLRKAQRRRESEGHSMVANTQSNIDLIFARQCKCKEETSCAKLVYHNRLNVNLSQGL